MHCMRQAIAQYGERDVARLMADPRIIRNGKKVAAVIANARAAVRLDATVDGGFVRWVYAHTPASPKERLLASGKEASNHMRTDLTTRAEDIAESDGVHPTAACAAFVAAAKAAGFTFVGPTTALSFMQACGVMNHHAAACWAFSDIEQRR